MVALLVGMAIMAVALSVALPAWSNAAKRERETELIFRGQQYARAIALFQRKNPNVFPPSFDILLRGRFLRKKYKDPMTPDGEFQPVYAGQGQPGQPTQGGPGGRGARGGQAGQASAAQGAGTQLEQLSQQTQGIPGARGGIPGGVVTGGTPGLIGVVSKSDATSLRVYNGRTKYNEWVFVATQASTAAGAGAARGARPGQRINPPGGLGGGTTRGGTAPGSGMSPFPSPFSPGPGPRGNQP